MELYSLLYISSSRVAADSPDMLAIADVAKKRNARCGVSGYLYYDSALFLQVLEGLKPDVETIFASIERDPRHDRIRVIASGPEEARRFGGWAMGLYNGELDGGLLAERFGRDIGERAAAGDAPELLRFLRDLSLGRTDVYDLPRRSTA